MGDLNWDKVDVEKLGTPRSSSRKLLAALKLKKRPKRIKLVKPRTKTTVGAYDRTKTVS